MLPPVSNKGGNGTTPPLIINGSLTLLEKD